jgi:hypothetical protein
MNEATEDGEEFCISARILQTFFMLRFKSANPIHVEVRITMLVNFINRLEF